MSDTNISNLHPAKLVMYSASWCPDCKRSKALLDSVNADYLEVDLGKNLDAYIFVQKLTRKVVVPTIIFPDGKIMQEPDDESLKQSLKIGQ